MADVNDKIDKEMEEEDNVSDLFDMRRHNTDGMSYKDQYWPKAGTTATCILITPDKAYYANVGDARTIMVKNGKAEQLT